MSKRTKACLTCYGTGEAVMDGGAPQTCPDCFGEGKQIGAANLEWRLRAIEGVHRHAVHETSSDVLWLVHEVRRMRDSLVRILARCQDADETDVTAVEVRHEANEALSLYETAS